MFTLSWVTLHIRDMERSLHFYRDTLGLAVAEDKSHDAIELFMLDGGGTMLELIHKEGEIVENPGQGVSVGLVTENLDALVLRLKASGLTQIRGPLCPTPHIKFYFLTDPDGYTVQLAEHL